jgi:hypothetical protein
MGDCRCLHLACRPEQHPPTQMDEEDEQNDSVCWINAGSAVVRALCGHSPKAANAQDKDGCNPLELALTTNGETALVSKMVCQLLFDTSKDVWDLECREHEEEARRQDEKFTWPGYSPSAAQVLLARCRSNSGRSHHGSDQGLSAKIASGGSLAQTRRTEQKNEIEGVKLPPHKALPEMRTQHHFLQTKKKMDISGQQTIPLAPSIAANSQRKSSVSPMA